MYVYLELVFRVYSMNKFRYSYIYNILCTFMCVHIQAPVCVYTASAYNAGTHITFLYTLLYICISVHLAYIYIIYIVYVLYTYIHIYIPKEKSIYTNFKPKRIRI